MKIQFVGRPMLLPFTPGEMAARPGSSQLYQVLHPKDETFGIIHEVYGTIIVPDHTVTDFASRPWYAETALAVLDKPLERDDPRILFPSIIHDYGYSVSGHVKGNEHPALLERATWDMILMDGIVACGGSIKFAGIIYASVRTGGGSHWTTLPGQ